MARIVYIALTATVIGYLTLTTVFVLNILAMR